MLGTKVCRTRAKLQVEKLLRALLFPLVRDVFLSWWIQPGERLTGGAAPFKPRPRPKWRSRRNNDISRVTRYPPLGIVARSDIDFIDPSEWPVGGYIFGEFPPGRRFRSYYASTIVIENTRLEWLFTLGSPHLPPSSHSPPVSLNHTFAVGVRQIRSRQ